MLICLASQASAFQLADILEFGVPSRINVRGTHVEHYPSKDCFIHVLSQRYSRNAQIVKCLTFLERVHRVLILDLSYDEIYPNDFTFMVENASELEDFSGIDISAQCKNKINARIFDLHSIEDNVRLGTNILIESILSGSVIFQTPYRRPHSPPRVVLIEEEEERPLKIVKMVTEQQCQICMDNDSSIMLGCGHKSMCEACADRYQGGTCPICRAKIDTIFK